MLSEAFAYHRTNLQSQPENYGEIVRARFSTGALVTSSDYVQAQRVRSRIRRETASALERVDLVALPGSRSPAPSFEGFEPLGRWKGEGFMSLANETGLPAICVPCGFTSDGLPAGIQPHGPPRRRADGAPRRLRLPAARQVVRAEAGVGGAPG